jgi:hypothetical protein
MRIVRICIVGLIVLAGGLAQAEEIDNPQFAYWKKFAEGSTAIHELTADRPDGQKFKTEITTKLVSKSDDEVTVERTTTMEFGGQKRTSPPKTEKIKAKVDNDKYDVKSDSGSEKIEAAGKTFDCKVIEIANPQNKDTTLKLWMSDQVPGGVVKIEAKAGQGSFSSLLKSFEAK